MDKENAIIIPLKTLLNTFGEEKTKSLLNSFSCSKNLDVEKFLKKSAILFENLNKGKTYLIFKEGSNEILAYFTLSISILRIMDPNVSKRTIKKLNGISKKKKRISCISYWSIRKK